MTTGLDFLRAPEDRLRLWRVFLRLLGFSFLAIALLLLFLALVTV